MSMPSAVIFSGHLTADGTVKLDARPAIPPECPEICSPDELLEAVR